MKIDSSKIYFSPVTFKIHLQARNKINLRIQTNSIFEYACKYYRSELQS